MIPNHLTTTAFFSALIIFVCFPQTLRAEPSGYNSGVKATVLKKTTTTGDGRKISYLCTDKPEVTVMTVDIAPGAETGWHSHPVPVYAFVVSGKIEVELKTGEKLIYVTGEPIIEVFNALHNGRNRGTEPVRLMVFYTGSEDMQNVVKEKKP